MIVTEPFDTRERRYSDKSVKLRQLETGNLYEDAVDVVPCRYTYEETEIAIPEPSEARVGSTARVAAPSNQAALETRIAALETENAALTARLTGGTEVSVSRKSRP